MRNQFRKLTGEVIVATGLLLAGRAHAGNLDPSHAPGPTMHSLEEIYQKLEAGTFTLGITNTVTVTNTVIIFTNALVPKTGQTNSYASYDDGWYSTNVGVAWPNPRFTVQADTNVVLDNLTGLMWARNANILGAVLWSAALNNCATLDYGGYTDWRLPNIKELTSLAAFAFQNPALCNTAGTGQWQENDPFKGVIMANYWSSTTHKAAPTQAWIVPMVNGHVIGGEKTTEIHYVWPVRGGF